MLSENTSSLTRILLNRAFTKSNAPESNQQERKEGKEEGEKKTEHSYDFISSTLVCQEKVTHYPAVMDSEEHSHAPRL